MRRSRLDPGLMPALCVVAQSRVAESRPVSVIIATPFSLTDAMANCRLQTVTDSLQPARLS